MFEWLADPVWGGISVLAPIAGWGLRRVYLSWKRRGPADQPPRVPHPVPPQSEAYALVNRVVSIYKAHGIERIQIPRLLGQDSGLTIAHMGDDEKLLSALSERVLESTCFRFGISREWLDGKDVPIYPYAWFDKNLKGFIDFLESLRSEFDEVEGFAIKSRGDKLEKDGHRYPLAFVFRGKIDNWGGPGDDSIWRYYPLNDTQFWAYGRTRIQIKAMVLAAWQFHIHVFGCELPLDQVEEIIKGRTFPGPLIENTHRAAWHPDDYIFAGGESACAKDVVEAKRVYAEMERLGWMGYLTEKTGAVPRAI